MSLRIKKFTPPHIFLMFSILSHSLPCRSFCRYASFSPHFFSLSLSYYHSRSLSFYIPSSIFLPASFLWSLSLSVILSILSQLLFHCWQCLACANDNSLQRSKSLPCRLLNVCLLISEDISNISFRLKPISNSSNGEGRCLKLRSKLTLNFV